MDYSKIKKVSIIGFFFIAIIGTLLHFTYEFSSNNYIVGAFSAVNESVWEHLKIAVMPALLYSLIQMYILRKNKINICFAALLKILTIIILIVGIFYTYTSIVGTHLLVVDILAFYIAIFLGELVSYGIMKNEYYGKTLNTVSCIMLVLIFTSFILFTYMPPELGIFRDSVTGKYGIIN